MTTSMDSSGLIARPPGSVVLSQYPRVPQFFNLTDDISLGQVLSRPYAYFLENGEHNITDPLLTRLQVEAPDFSLAISTGTAYKNLVANVFAQQLNQRFGLQGYKSMQIETCLQEAMINAIVHGNLGIDSRFESLEGFDAHYALIESRLEKPAYVNRRIIVSAWSMDHHVKITITDQGDGFRFAPGLPEDGLPHGRGLFFIQSLADRVWLGEDKRTLCMNFTY